MYLRQAATVVLLMWIQSAPALGRQAWAQAADEPASATDAATQPTAGPQPQMPPLTWYRGNLHTHSLWSDGNDFPEMIAAWYREHGYHFLALSDHNILSQGEKWLATSELGKRGSLRAIELCREKFGDDWVQLRVNDGREEVRLQPLSEFRPLVEDAGRFLLIPGEEISDHFGALPIHINASNLLEVIKPTGGETLRETILNNLEAVEQQSIRTGQPILAHLNHPNFGYAVTAEDLAHVVKERFFEVFNGHPSVENEGDATHPGVERMWDIANTLRIAELNAPPLFGLATDDSHNYFGHSGPSPGRGWVMVQARRLTPNTIIQALEAGTFYASTGVTLASVRFDADRQVLELEIEPQPDAEYTTSFIGTLKDYDPTRTEVLDDKGQKVATSLRYSETVGQVLATEKGTRVSYQLTGQELYVRARVTSSLPPENPMHDLQRQQAWTQPVGWEKHLPRKD